MSQFKEFFVGLEEHMDYEALLQDLFKHVLIAAEKAAKDSSNTQVDDKVVEALKLLNGTLWSDK